MSLIAYTTWICPPSPGNSIVPILIIRVKGYLRTRAAGRSRFSFVRRLQSGVEPTAVVYSVVNGECRQPEEYAGTSRQSPSSDLLARKTGKPAARTQGLRWASIVGRADGWAPRIWLMSSADASVTVGSGAVAGASHMQFDEWAGVSNVEKSCAFPPLN